MKIQILFALLVLLFMHSAQAKYTDYIKNKDTLRQYLSATSHPDFPNEAVVALYEVAATGYASYATFYNYEVAYKVYNVDKIGDLADVAIPKSKQLDVSKLKAVTYNLVNDEIVETPLKKTDFSKSNYSKGSELIKFSFEGVKNGSIIVYKFSIEDIVVPQSWNFQKDFPVLHSEFKFTTYRAFNFTENVSVPFVKASSLSAFENSTDLSAYYTNMSNMGKQFNYYWIRRNIPPFKEEKFKTSDAKVREHVRVGKSESAYRIVSKYSWDQINGTWYSDSYSHIFKRYDFLDAELPKLLGDVNLADTFAIVNRLYNYFQDSFLIKHSNDNLETSFKKMKGTDVMLNSILINIYRHLGINSDLLLTSSIQKHPLRHDTVVPGNVNVSAVRVEFGGVNYFLAPAHKGLPFGFLPINYYNGYARIVNELGGFLELDPKYAIDYNNTDVQFYPTKEGYGIRAIRELGVYTGGEFRDNWAADSTAMRQKMENFFDGMSTDLNIKVTKAEVFNVSDKSKKIKIRYDATLQFDNDKPMVIINPYLIKIFNGENPFSDEERINDIGFNRNYVEHYKISFQLAPKMSVEDMPVSQNISFGNENQLSLDQQITEAANGENAILTYKYERKPIIIPASEYDKLKLFFDNVSDFFNQKIVFRKL